jgi:beta-glucosidase
MHLSFAELPDAACALALEADLVVAVVGEHPMRSGENNNVSELGLPPGQSDFVRRLAQCGKPLVLVVLSGRPLAIPVEAAMAQAMCFVFHPGTEGAAAIADILFGEAEPGGRLPMSIPRATGQVPIYYNHKNSGRPVRPGYFSRRYVDLAHGPLYPFGYGLGYTQFAYRDLQLNSTHMRDELDISLDLANVGNRSGVEVVQLYLRDHVGQVTRPVKELKGFRKISLDPGESQRVHFVLRREDLAFVGLADNYIIEAGDYDVWVGPSSAGGLQGHFTLL